MTVLSGSIFQLAEIAKQMNKREITTKLSQTVLQNSELCHQLNSQFLFVVVVVVESLRHV